MTNTTVAEPDTSSRYSQEAVSQTDETQVSNGPFDEVKARSSVDYLLRTVQTGQFQMSALADMKANIMITIASIVISVSIGQLDNNEYRLPLLILCFFSLISLLWQCCVYYQSLASRALLVKPKSIR